MKFNVSGIIDVPNGRRKFSREVEAKSEKHAKEIVYSFFGSSTGLIRNKVKIESVAKVG